MAGSGSSKMHMLILFTLADFFFGKSSRVRIWGFGFAETTVRHCYMILSSLIPKNMGYSIFFYHFYPKIIEYEDSNGIFIDDQVPKLATLAPLPQAERWAALNVDSLRDGF